MQTAVTVPPHRPRAVSTGNRRPSLDMRPIGGDMDEAHANDVRSMLPEAPKVQSSPGQNKRKASLPTASDSNDDTANMTAVAHRRRLSLAFLRGNGQAVRTAPAPEASSGRAVVETQAPLSPDISELPTGRPSTVTQVRRGSVSCRKPADARARRRSVDSGLNFEQSGCTGAGVVVPGVPRPIPAQWTSLGASGSSTGRRSAQGSPALRLSIDSGLREPEENRKRILAALHQCGELSPASVRSLPSPASSIISNGESQASCGNSPSNLTRPPAEMWLPPRDGTDQPRRKRVSLKLDANRRDVPKLPVDKSPDGSDDEGNAVQRAHAPNSTLPMAQSDLTTHEASNARRSSACAAKASDGDSSEPSFTSQRRASVSAMIRPVAKFAESLSFRSGRTNVESVRERRRTIRTRRASESSVVEPPSVAKSSHSLSAKLNEALAPLHNEVAKMRQDQLETLARVEEVRGELKLLSRRILADGKWM